MNNRKAIAFYLPQFHSIAENDKWWGKGFTEWDNVKKAQPLFKEHNQPNVPLNNNYYCLLDKDTLKWQVDLAKTYHIYGFCFYHYWFKNGKKLLEKPVEMFLNNKDLDIHFCLSWANEAWAKTWDGGHSAKKNEILMEQEYGDEQEWEKHFYYLLPFFKDKRYICMDNKPVMIIYKPNLIKNISKMIQLWKKLGRKNGIKDIIFMYQSPEGYFDGFEGEDEFNYLIRYEPLFSGYVKNKETFIEAKRNRAIFNGDNHFVKFCINSRRNLKKKYIKMRSIASKLIKKENKRYSGLRILDYDERWNCIIKAQKECQDSRIIPGGFVAWDNTPRKRNGIVYKGATPKKFEKYLKELITVSTYDQSNLLFINAWNEWAEGAYLEPDEKNRFGYLETVQRIFDREE